MKVFSSKKYEILDSGQTEGMVFKKTEQTKFIIDVDIMQGTVLKVSIPANGVITSRNQDFTMHKEEFTSKTELFIGIDEGLDSIEFSDGAVVEVQEIVSDSSGSGSVGGSAEIPTCTVKFIVGENGWYQGYLAYTKYEDGAISEVYVNDDWAYKGAEIILENVVCSSIIYITWDSIEVYFTPQIYIDGNSSVLHMMNRDENNTYLFTAQPEQNSTSTITLSAILVEDDNGGLGGF